MDITIRLSFISGMLSIEDLIQDFRHEIFDRTDFDYREKPSLHVLFEIFGLSEFRCREQKGRPCHRRAFGTIKTVDLDLDVGNPAVASREK